MQDEQQLADVLEVQAGGGLVEDVDRAPGRALLQLRCELHPLGLTAGERGGRLTHAHVAEADVDQGRQVAGDRRDGREELQRLLDRHVEDLGDGLALVVDLERLAVVAIPLADLAWHVHIGQEVHLDPDRAVTRACLAATALDVEREPSLLVTADLRLRGVGEELADVVEHPGVRRGVAPGGAADRALVDMHDLVEVLEAVDAPMATGHDARPVDLTGEDVEQDVVDEGRLARAAHPGHGHEAAERDRHRHITQVVLAGGVHGERPVLSRAADRGHRDAARAREVLPGDRLGVREQVAHRPAGDDPTAVLARPGPDVDHPVRPADRVLVVLHDDEGVAEVTKPHEGLDEAVVVALVQADARLVEDVEHADEPGADLGGQADPLRLAAGERRRRSVEGEVVQPHVDEELQPLIHLRTRAAIAASRWPRVSDCRRTVSSPMGMAASSAIERPATVTASERGFSRLPAHAWQGTSRM